MRWHSIRKRSTLRAIPPKVKLEGWGDNVINVTPIDLQ
jgi:hypothetical protein